MSDISYPCTACLKRGCAASGRRCPLWVDWFRERWAGLAGAREREKYKAWLMLLYQRATWEEKAK